ncbi:MAG: accessory Sec system translocase SecA2 [Deltaproteobacteria bacterium]|nr:MAG: accessory Sec system translocase SecA2 [Deltaproteobacteria bacterium]
MMDRMPGLGDSKVAATTRIARWLDQKRGRPVQWQLSPYLAVLDQIDVRAAELQLSDVADSVITERARRLADAAVGGASSESLLVETYALGREASVRTIGLRHFDVQMVAAIALRHQRFIEMQTGEGKTLVAVLPAVLAALSGQAVHVLTFNDYLAQRDAEWMRPVYELLGLSVGHVVQGMTRRQRRRAYGASVTYATARETGYDYLRHCLLRDRQEVILRPPHWAIVDEADSILIDEARVPLVIAGSEGATIDERRSEFAELTRQLAKPAHYDTGDDGRNVSLTDEGREVVQARLGCGDLAQLDNLELLTGIHQALHAEALLCRDVDYILRDGQVSIVDELTGRVVPDRHWPDGLHRAVEAKEGLRLGDQGRILSSITMQHLINRYPNLCGMTGTIIPSEDELWHFYGRPTVVIPPNQSCNRIDLPDLVFTHQSAKRAAIVSEVLQCRETSRPVLIGTSSVAESQRLAREIRDAGIQCAVLNAKNDEAEAKIVAQAGAPGAVTVSTNMAGRGTDIRLGGEDGRWRDPVVACGGLYVIGTSRFESRRVDDQLRGRAGRQGDPGSTRFFVSLEDDLMVRFDVGRWIPRRHRRRHQVEPIDDPVIGEKIATTQRIIEGQHFDIRKTLWSYSSFVDEQRRVWHDRREAVLLGQAPSLLAAGGSAKYERVCATLGESLLAEVEAQITLVHMDRCWADQLARIADVREGITLVRIGGQEPLYEFYRQVAEHYAELEARVGDAVRETFEAASITEAGIDLDREGLAGPSATWTYLVNDDPFSWLGSIADLSNIGYGVTTGLYFGGFFLARSLYRRLFGKGGK